MLACRVCLAVGIDDPEGWLDTVTDRQLTLWAAFYSLEPWGAEFHRSAEQSSLMSGLLAINAASVGGELEPRPVEDFMPSNWADAPRKKRKKKRVNTKSLFKTLSAAFPTADKRRVR